jgi:hypothetical protein
VSPPPVAELIYRRCFFFFLLEEEVSSVAGHRSRVAADCRSDPNSKKLPKLLVLMQIWTAELDIGDHADFFFTIVA